MVEKNRSERFEDLFKKLSLFGLPITVIFSGILQVFIYFLGKYWLKNIGIDIELNIFESSNFTTGLILTITAGLICFYLFILFFTFIFIRDGLEYGREWIESALNWLKQKTPSFKKIYALAYGYGILATTFVILPFFILIFLHDIYKNDFLKLILLALTCFLFFLFPLRVVWKYYLEQTKEKSLNAKNEYTAYKAWWGIFLLAGFLTPFLITLLHLWIPYWVYAFFLGIVFSAHFASFLFLNIKNPLSILFAIAILVLLAFTNWFDIVKRSAVETKEFIIHNERTHQGRMAGLFIFPKIEQGDIYVENRDFFDGIRELEGFKSRTLRGNILQEVKFLELKGYNYIFIPFYKETIGILEVKDGKIIKFILPNRRD